MTSSALARLLRLGAILVACSLAPAQAQEPVQLTFGEAGGRQAMLVFSPDSGGPEALVVSTVNVGVAGSRLSLSVDRIEPALVTRILSTEDCGFAEAGSQCRFAVAGGTAEYATIVDAFKRGLTLHIEIENAGTMEMSQDVSLVGFTKAYGAL